MEGAIIFGLTLALHGNITAKDGAIEQSNFHDYPLLRLNEAPGEIHVHLVESDAPPGGVGEPGVPPVAPALTNALLKITGNPVRELPIRLA
jgi:isoquinoline 1-oxidoreductase beta subunit